MEVKNMTTSMDTYSYSTAMTSEQSTASLIVTVVGIIAMWKLFSKAGQAGWKSLIPIYNVYTFVKIVDGNGWKFLLLLLPFVNVIYAIILTFRTAKAYGKGVGFGFGLLFLGFIFTLILAFGKAQYVGPKGQVQAA